MTCLAGQIVKPYVDWIGNNSLCVLFRRMTSLSASIVALTAPTTTNLPDVA